MHDRAFTKTHRARPGPGLDSERLQRLDQTRCVLTGRLDTGAGAAAALELKVETTPPRALLIRPAEV